MRARFSHRLYQLFDRCRYTDEAIGASKASTCSSNIAIAAVSNPAKDFRSGRCGNQPNLTTWRSPSFLRLGHVDSMKRFTMLTVRENDTQTGIKERSFHHLLERPGALCTLSMAVTL